MSLIPSFFGGQENDPFSLDVWDPSKNFPFNSSSLSFPRQTRQPRKSGSFLRRFRLPENAKVDEVKASMENGVLTVTVPKEEVKKSEVKSVEISG
ncbi:hypothetical protein IFM89_012017 [Coptis chinensis]|uniref:SHSP domain-containing protein n=1 Tax=Coptis chinensis TaxID=261450 RepID=A0A835M9T1_9MAGN|nr:hypothetical protein IFM89_012017 [Coptis chinensis]